MKSFSYYLKRYYNKRFLPRIRKALGVDAVREDLLTLLDSAADITKCRPANGKLREIQLADTELLKLFDMLCAEHGLMYWLDWGTLLGAVRHKGFIPWDDDLDVCMPRSEYLRALPIISDYFAGRDGFITESIDLAEKKWMWIGFWPSGVLLDIFPVDDTAFDGELSSNKTAVTPTRQTDENSAPLEPAEEKTLSPLMVFPLRRIPFEHYEFFVPNDYQTVLKIRYGDYMSFPKSGVCHHKLLINNPDITDETIKEAARAICALQTEFSGKTEEFTNE